MMILMSAKKLHACRFGWLGGVSYVTRNSCLDFEADLHSDLDPGILFLLRLFALCKTSLLYYCLLGVSAVIPVVLVTV